ncbi:SDR family oxidoreductase [Actinomadura rubrisoli]|uniref:SDR family oxidoreductase n=1 Tax=Actinomadura rubrisoli TaxID=2530368 RepID=UPI001404AC39|nr:SDR family oxidoreductase [Actinomadura rubrisoli]
MTATPFFRDRLVLVTGGARGVGREIVRMLVAQGAHVIINYFHSRDAARDLRAEITERGGRADLIWASVAKQDHVERMFEEITERHGHLDTLINNAAAGAVLPPEQLEETHWLRGFRTNVLGSFWCSMGAARLMADRPGAAIVNLSSIGSDQVTHRDYMSLGCTKAGVEALTRYLAVELAPRGIRVNTASAGLLASEVAGLFHEADRWKNSICESTALHRLGTMAELAALVLFLASDDAQWITGQRIVADGGFALAPGPLGMWPGHEAAMAPDVAATPSAPPARPAYGGPVAVVGAGVAVPGASTLEELWELLQGDRDVFSEPDRYNIDDFHCPDPAVSDRTYTRVGGYVKALRAHPELARELRAGDWPSDTELAPRLLRHCLHQALEGVARDSADRWLFSAGTGLQYLFFEHALMNSSYLARFEHLLDQGPLRDAVASALSAHYHHDGVVPRDMLSADTYRMVASGLLPESTEMVSVDTACSTGLYALDLGIRAIREGSCDVAACGTAFEYTPRLQVLLARAHAISRSGRVRAFDRDGDGTIFGEGAGMVILKPLDRAHADGDPVLAVLAGTGVASDGKAKAIYAPNAAGQRKAISHAWRDAGIGDRDIDWVIAHGTGTPAGDETELAVLSELIGTQGAPCPITSNKPIVGHTGSTAGMVSLLHAILAMRHDLIPAQRMFSGPRTPLDPARTRSTIPTDPVPWPSRLDRPRIAGISSFGFGGTDAHLIVADDHPALPAPEANVTTTGDPMVLVGWAGGFPGEPEGEQGAPAAWLRGRGRPPPLDFGAAYPPERCTGLQIPPAVIEHLDRVQMMALEATGRLAASLGAAWEELTETTGVIVANMSGQRRAEDFGERIYLDDCGRALSALPDQDTVAAAMEGLRDQVRNAVPATTEDSIAGCLANLAAGRVANYYNLRGPNILMDAGLDSAAAALRCAERWLRHGVCRLALVHAVNGNATESWRALLNDLVPPGRSLAEGALAWALTTRSFARRRGLPVLATIATEMGTGGEAGSDSPVRGTAWSMPPLRGADRTYLAADGLIAGLNAVLANRTIHLSPGTPDAPRIIIEPGDGRYGEGADEGADENADKGAGEGADEGTGESAARSPADEHDVVTLSLRPSPLPARSVRRPTQALPAHTLVVTDDAGLAEQVTAAHGSERGDMAIWCPAGQEAPCPEAVPVDPLHAAAAAAELPFKPRHVRVLARLPELSAAPDAPDAPVDRLLILHDLTFAALQASFGDAAESGSFVIVLKGGLRRDSPAAFAGLFTGLTKTSHLESPGIWSCCLLLDDQAADAEVLSILERESTAFQPATVVAYRDRRRLTYALEQVETARGPGTHEDLSLNGDSVVVATGGGRGITARVLTALAERTGCHLYLLGRTDPSTLDDGPLPSRQDFLRLRLAAAPGRSVREANQLYERQRRAHEVRATCEALSQHVGGDHVHYLRCDVGDLAAVQSAIRLITERHQRIDLLIHGAGQSASKALARKTVQDFRRVRDTKVRGYLNLRAALQRNAPTRWCNFSSLAALTGQPGDHDYVAANDFLLTAAWASRQDSASEYSLLWSAWSDVGMASDDLVAGRMRRNGPGDTPISPERGVAQFLRAQASEPPPVLAYPRSAEARTLGDIGLDRPSETDPETDREPDPGPEAFSPTPMLDQQVSRGADQIVFTKTFTTEGDWWLPHHVIDDRPTVPGVFTIETAVEAANRFRPDLRLLQVRGLRLHAPITVRPGRSRAVKVRATLLSSQDEQATVAVHVLSDVIAPNGTLLRADRLHHEVTVVLAKDLPPAPRWDHPEPLASVAQDPTAVPTRFLRLTGPFASIIDPRHDERGSLAHYGFPALDSREDLRGFLAPVLMMDAMVRMPMFCLSTGNRFFLGQITEVNRIDVHADVNDLDIIDTYRTRTRLWVNTRENQQEVAAVAPDGTVLLRMTGLRYVSHAILDAETGAISTEPGAGRPLAFGGPEASPLPESSPRTS